MSDFNQLESIAAKAESFDKFIKNPALVAQYTDAAARVFQSNPRAESIAKNALQSLSHAATLAPWISERLWQLDSPPVEFSLDLEKTYGRHINMEAWNVFFTQALQELKKESAPLALDDSSEKSFKKGWLEILRPLQERIAKFQILFGTPQSQKMDFEKNWTLFCVQTRSNPTYSQLAAALVHYHLTQTRYHEAWESADASHILNQFKYLRQNASRVFSEPTMGFFSNHESVQSAIEVIESFIVMRIPNPDKLLKMTEIFPQQSSTHEDDPTLFAHSQFAAGTYVFKSPPRRIHSVLAMAFSGDCSLGLTEDILSRWACLLSKEARVLTIHRKGTDSFYGSLQMTPVVDQNGKAWSCVEPWSRFFNYKCSEPHSSSAEILFIKTLRALHKLTPNIIVGQDRWLDNYTTMELFSLQADFIGGKELESSLRLQDAQVDELIQAHGEWQKFCPDYWHKLPLLSCLSPQAKPRLPQLLQTT